eukprot:Lankesteria_metandrocarpae@DN5187_c0_g2_i2.p1
MTPTDAKDQQCAFEPSRGRLVCSTLRTGGTSKLRDTDLHPHLQTLLLYQVLCQTGTFGSVQMHSTIEPQQQTRSSWQSILCLYILDPVIGICCCPEPGAVPCTLR